mgnify:FL=1
MLDQKLHISKKKLDNDPAFLRYQRSIARYVIIMIYSVVDFYLQSFMERSNRSGFESERHALIFNSSIPGR